MSNVSVSGVKYYVHMKINPEPTILHLDKAKRTLTHKKQAGLPNLMLVPSSPVWFKVAQPTAESQSTRDGASFLKEVQKYGCYVRMHANYVFEHENLHDLSKRYKLYVIRPYTRIYILPANEKENKTFMTLLVGCAARERDDSIVLPKHSKHSLKTK
ncbi:hypothetical protein M501DRAFT_1016659 [Patellaria atrata CBS 101060]|uniref:Uncharacterized protein n=1 Tax=Patellaria atrata CBS 101060 TaxID=1346257 RepID=A0A9P4SB79_9PEZI|nr:hypothetical protein M501DRAFT_1016659 [Patellaria atrata CBS 101060]